VTLFDEAVGAPAPPDPLLRVRMLLGYDGSGFHGFAPQPGVRTVGGVLGEALERVLGHPVELTCAGRTDKGVHAWGQVVSFDAAADRFDPAALQRALTGLCGPELAVREVAAAAPEFDARFSARSRTYRYTVLNRPVPDPFRRHLAWHVAEPLQPELLELACDPFLGEHDFSAFCRRPKVPRGGEPASLVRDVQRAEWSDLGEGLLRFEIEATAFCHQMVRSIVGTIVAAGHRRIRAGDIRGILASRDRNAAPPLAPPHGLCLWHVTY
jgi:tRNA pseudouridine38-40 synthase